MTRLTDEQRRDRAVSEAAFLDQVIELARILHWRVAHFRPAWSGRGWRTPVQADGAGFPDLVMLRGGRIVAAELKRETGAATAEQIAWVQAFAEAGAETFVWRPSDLEVIAAVLR